MSSANTPLHKSGFNYYPLVVFTNSLTFDELIKLIYWRAVDG